VPTYKFYPGDCVDHDIKPAMYPSDLRNCIDACEMEKACVGVQFVAETGDPSASKCFLKNEDCDKTFTSITQQKFNSYLKVIPPIGLFPFTTIL
jgi:hypothetical protein